MQCSDDLIIIQMQNRCNSAHFKAIKHIKDNTVKYLAAGQTPITVNKVQVKHKMLHGLNNRTIGCLLIPADNLHGWDMDPNTYIHLPHTILTNCSCPQYKIRANYLSGMLSIWGMSIPAFLYENYTYNHKDPKEGLFQGAFLVCMSQNNYLYSY